MSAFTDLYKEKIIADVSALSDDDQDRFIQIVLERGLVQVDADGTVEFDLNLLEDSALLCVGGRAHMEKLPART
jgi:hypothetical protein